MLIETRFDATEPRDHEVGYLAELDRAVEHLGPIDRPAISVSGTRLPVADGLDRGRRVRSLAFRLAAKHAMKRLRRLVAGNKQALHRGPHMVYPDPQDVARTVKTSTP